MIYFTSDLHFGHRAILGMQNRPFADVEEMNRVLIRNINSMVTNGDKLFILGDVSHHISAEETDALISKLKGKKYLLIGNHDMAGGDGKPDYDPTNFVEIADYLRINEYGMNMVLMHYPLLTWYRLKRGSVMLHGHIHATRDYNESNMAHGIRRFDVGVDANDYFPVPITTIRNWAERTAVAEERTEGYIPGPWAKEDNLEGETA